MSKELDVEVLRAQLHGARQRVKELEKALEEVALAEGPYSRDRLTHAENTIEAMVEIAERAIGWRR